MAKRSRATEEWRNSWKDNWKGRWQGEDGYQYDRDADRSKFDILKESLRNSKSEYPQIRKQGRKSAAKVIIPSVLSFILIVILILKIYGII